MIAALIAIGEQAPASERVLAARLEARNPGLHVCVVDLHPRRPGPDAPGVLDRALERLLELEPAAAGICCTPWNVELALQLCGRLRQVAPEVELLLGGAEARARSAELAPLARVLQGPALEDLERLLRELGALPPGPPEPPAVLDPPGPLAGLEHQALDGRWSLVEPAWGGGHPLWLHLHGQPARDTLDHAEALEQLRPLLRAGRRVLLADPRLCSDPRRLSDLLSALEPGSAARLQLAVPDAALDEELLAALCRVGLRRLDLDLTATGRGELSPQRLRRRVQTLQGQQLHVRGELTYGAPHLDRRGFDSLVNAALAAGIEELSFWRLLVTPGSALRSQLAALELRHAADPPYEVLRHRLADLPEVLRQARFAASFPPLASVLAGTGLLRVLAREQGAVVELVERFMEGRSLERAGPSPAASPELLGGQFFQFLRDELGLELDPGQQAARLIRPASLSLSWTGDGRRLVTDDNTGKTAHVGRGALRLLDGFGQARTIHDACEALAAEAPPASRRHLRRDLEATLDKLVSMGFLVPEPGQGEARAHPERPFISLEELDYHYRMLADQARVEAYQQAIAQTVRPGQHVVEIGTGTGILAVLAARAGARVTAIERYSVLSIAREVARSSGVADQIEFVRGRADLVQLKRPGDLLISELVGNRILNEGLLETTLDARRRLLRPEAGLVPRRLEILVALCHTTHMDHVAGAFRRLGQRYGVSLEPISSWFEQSLAAGQVVWEMGATDDDLEPLSEEQPMVSIDLATVARAGFAASARVQPTRPGLANAAVLSFRLELLPGVELSTAGQGHGLHWNKPVYMLPQPVPCEPGDPPQVRLSYQAHGELKLKVTP